MSTYTGDDKLYRLENNLTLTYLGTFSISGVGNDLTSCNFPMTVLPVIWQSFSGKLENDGQASLKWVVSQQVDNKGYYIEHSQDGTKWEQIGFIPNSNTQEEMSYSYTHSNPVNGKNFYRIQQVNYNGSGSYSMTKMINVENNSPISLWPNPTRDLIQIRTGAKNSCGFTLQIFDRSGKLISQNMLKAGVSTININSLSTGIYLVHVQLADGEVYNQKLMKQ
jgi:hypothetical protein